MTFRAPEPAWVADLHSETRRVWRSFMAGARLSPFAFSAGGAGIVNFDPGDYAARGTTLRSVATTTAVVAPSSGLPARTRLSSGTSASPAGIFGLPTGIVIGGPFQRRKGGGVAVIGWRVTGTADPDARGVGPFITHGELGAGTLQNSPAVGIGYDRSAGDTQLYLQHRGASDGANATRVALGALGGVLDDAAIYSSWILWERGDDPPIHVVLYRHDVPTLVVGQGAPLSTNLPPIDALAFFEPINASLVADGVSRDAEFLQVFGCTRDWNYPW